MVRGRNQLPTTRARDTSVQATVSGRVSKSYLVNSLLSAHCLLLYCWTFIETRNKCLSEAVTAACWLSSHQCLFPKQSTLSSQSWPGRQSGCVRSLRGRNAGVSWWSELREATLTPVQTAATADQLRVALVWSQHPVSGEQSSELTDNSQLMRPDLVWGSLSLEVKSEDWDWGHFLENFCKLSAAAATEAENNQRN